MKTDHSYPCVVTIAGSDPSGGAGIQADIKTISALGCYAASILTALTAQNTTGVQSIQRIPLKFIKQQIESVFSDLTVHAVKIGMLHNRSIINLVATMLKKFRSPIVIFDPVMISKNGCALFQPDIISHLKNTLFPLVSLITPNLPEAEKLLGYSIRNKDEMEQAAKDLADRYQLNVLIKGGHLNSDQSSDVLYTFKNNTLLWFSHTKIITNNTHGTGCTLSSAIAAYMARGYILSEAIRKAKKYLTLAIQSGSRFKIGNGAGPVDHFYYLREHHGIIDSSI